MYTSLLLALAPAVLAAPLIKQSNPIPGKYIVKFKTDAITSMSSIKAQIATAPEYEYTSTGFKGFAGALSAEELSKLQASSAVSSTRYSVPLTHILLKPPHAGRIYRSRCRSKGFRYPIRVERSLGYVIITSLHKQVLMHDKGLGRISHVTKGNTTYAYDSSGGEGTCSYVIDTGILTSHPEFEGRAEWLENFTDDGNDADGYGM